MEGLWGKPHMDSESGKARWLVKGNPAEMPHISDSNYQEGTTLSEPAHVSIHTYSFSPSKHFTCFTTFQLYVEIYFYTADGLGPCH